MRIQLKNNTSNHRKIYPNTIQAYLINPSSLKESKVSTMNGKNRQDNVKRTKKMRFRMIFLLIIVRTKQKLKKNKIKRMVKREIM